jgi:hypothetical protein
MEISFFFLGLYQQITIKLIKMKIKNFIFVAVSLVFLATSCTPQAIDEHTTEDNIKGQTETTTIEKKDIKIPSNG